MMYSEFVAGTGCKENEHNYKVYRDLEVMYMNSDLSKDEIYEYGKKLVDNSKSEEEIRVENRINSEIEDEKDLIKWYKEKITLYTMFINETQCSFEEEKEYKDWIKSYENMIKRSRNKINELKRILGD